MTTRRTARERTFMAYALVLPGLMVLVSLYQLVERRDDLGVLMNVLWPLWWVLLMVWVNVDTKGAHESLPETTTL